MTRLPAVGLVGLICLMGWSGCRMFGEVAAGGSVSEETNGSLVGRVTYADGSPAAGASVRVRPRDFLKDTADLDSAPTGPDAITGTDGHYRVNALRPGPYTVEIQDGRARAALASGNVLPGYGLDLDSIALHPVGGLEGRLEAVSGAASSGFVQIYGLDRLARADSNGRFSFADLPAGITRIRPVSPERGRAYREPAAVVVNPGDTSRVGVLPLVDFALEDYALWPQSRNIFLNTPAAGIADTLADYPVLVRLHAANFDFSQSDGRDIRFSTPGGRRLPYEVERWDGAGKKAEVWVRLDTLWGGTRDRFITLYWGNPAAPDFSNGPAVFANQAGVWHLEPRSLTPDVMEFPDASPSKAHGQAQGQGRPGNKEGAIGKGSDFGGAQSIRAPGKAAMQPLGQVSLAGWILATGADPEGGEIVSFGNNYGLRLTNAGEPYFYLFDDTLYQGVGSLSYDRWKLAVARGLNLRDSRWHHLAAVWDGAAMRLYVDGIEKTRLPLKGRIAYFFEKALWIGRLGADTVHDFHGQLDEIRVSAEAWSAGRVKTDYESQKPGSALLEFR